MAQIDDGELVALIEEAIDRYVTSDSVNPENVCRSVAQIIVRELHRAGAIVIREERRRPARAPEAAAEAPVHSVPS
jgi:hypothetical protein